MRSENSLRKANSAIYVNAGINKAGQAYVVCGACAQISFALFEINNLKLLFFENEFKKETIKQSTIQKKEIPFTYNKQAISRRIHIHKYHRRQNFGFNYVGSISTLLQSCLVKDFIMASLAC